jgi:hypothetical protein
VIFKESALQVRESSLAGALPSAHLEKNKPLFLCMSIVLFRGPPGVDHPSPEEAIITLISVAANGAWSGLKKYLPNLNPC